MTSNRSLALNNSALKVLNVGNYSKVGIVLMVNNETVETVTVDET